MDKDWNVRRGNVKLEEENVGKKSWHWSGQWFGFATKNKSEKSKNRQIWFHKPKSLATAKKAINRVKRQLVG